MGEIGKKPLKTRLNNTIMINTDNTKVNAELLERYNEAIEALKRSNRALSEYSSDHAINAYMINESVIKKSEQNT